MKRWGIILGGALVLSGCLATKGASYPMARAASGYIVTYQSFPESATVVCDGVTKGQTPVAVIYRYDREEMGANDLLFIDRCKAVWMSGAEQNYPDNVKIDPLMRMSTIGASRPSNVAGLQQDMAFDQQRKSTINAQKLQEERLKLEREKLLLEKDRRDELLDDLLQDSDLTSEVRRYPYSKTTFDVYYGSRKIEGAHASSFEALRYGYAKDTWNAYYQGQKIADARGNSFEVLAPNYAKDTWNVYYRGTKITGATASRFEVLGLGYAKDVWNVYYRGLKLEGASPNSFKVDSRGYASDIRNRYHNGRLL